MKSLLLLTLYALLKYTGAVCYSGSSPILCSDASCGGSCTSDNGCLCFDYTTNCMPTTTECPMEDNSCCASLAGWYWNSTSGCCMKTPQCNPPCAIDEYCTLLGSDATCVCNNTIYLGIKTSYLKPTVKCDNVMVASVSQCQLKQLGYNYSSMVLTNDSSACTFIYPDIISNIRVESIQVRPAKGWCGSIFSNDSSKIYFTNTAHIYQNYGLLITKNPIVFNFSCVYNLTMQTSLNFSLNPILSSIVLPPPSPGTGYLTVTMAAYSNAAFNDPIQENQEILVGSDIYLGVFSPGLDAETFALRVESCFATPSSDPNGPTNLQFVKGGCAVSDDILTAVLENGNSSEARIQTSAFLFQGYTEVYIFCDVKICQKTNGCGGCASGRAAGDSSQLGMKLNLQGYDYSNSSGDHTAASWAMLAASLLGLLFVKLF